MTRRLYHDDAYLRRFEAQVVAMTTYRDKPAVVLDQTAFYPEAGGQLGDRGTLDGVAVIDTQAQDDGTIVHLVEAPLAVGSTATGELDWARRRQHMAQHTAQHLEIRCDRLGRLQIERGHSGCGAQPLWRGRLHARRFQRKELQTIHRAVSRELQADSGAVDQRAGGSQCNRFRDLGKRGGEFSLEPAEVEQIEGLAG